MGEVEERVGEGESVVRENDVGVGATGGSSVLDLDLSSTATATLFGKGLGVL